MTNPNPLSKYFRQPSIYIKLPSGGKWWKNNSLTIPPNGELPIMAMTGKDELALRNADGLMNGSSTVDIIQSCVPNIKNAWDMPTVDVDAVFMSIRQATYGNDMDFSSTCSKCSHVDDFTADLSVLVAGIKIPNYDSPLNLDNGLYIFLKPATYNIQNMSFQEAFAQERTIDAIRKSNVPEEEKIKSLKETLSKLTDITVARLSEFIEKIMLPDGSVVTDQNQIAEFILNAPQKEFQMISEGIQQKNNEYSMPKITVTCTECGHKEEREFQMDPAQFFG